MILMESLKDAYKALLEFISKKYDPTIKQVTTNEGEPMNQRLIDLLYTTRWGIKAGKTDFAYDTITEAIDVARGGVDEPEEEDRPDAKDEDETKRPHVYKKELWIKDAVKGPNVVVKGKYSTPTGFPIGAVVHFTAGWNKPGNAAKSLERTKYGFHCIDIEQGWFQPKNMPLNIWGNHAGTSKSVLKGYGATSSNSNKLLGIEMNCGGKLTKKGSKFYTWFDKEVHPDNVRELKTSTNDYGPKGYYEKYSEKQEEDLINGLVWLCLNDNNFHWENIVGHHEIAGMRWLGRWRKNDPGGSLSMSMEELRQTVRRKVEAALK